MTENLKGPDLQDVFTESVLHCRTCFTTSSIIYNPLGPAMINCLLECVSLRLHENELNNVKVCQSCSQIMETFIQFKNKCHEVDALFKTLNLNETSNNKLNLDQKITALNNTIVKNTVVKTEYVEPNDEFNSGEIYNQDFNVTMKCEIKSMNDSSDDNGPNEEYNIAMMKFQEDYISRNQDEDNEIDNAYKSETKRKQSNDSKWMKVLPKHTPEIVARINEPRKCKLCDLPCQNGRSLMKHMSTGHKDLKPTFFCQEPKQLARCKGGFKCEEALMLHVYSRHMTKWKLMHGVGEDNAINKEYDDDDIENNHNKKQPYGYYYEKLLPPNNPEIIAKINEPRDCQVCGLACQNGRSLTRHMNATHKNLKPTFFCQDPKQLPSCKLGFKCEEALMLHTYSYHIVKRIKIKGKKPVDPSKSYLSEDHAIKKELVDDDDDVENTNEKKTKENIKPDGSYWERVLPPTTPEIIARIDEPRNCKLCGFACQNGRSLIKHLNNSHRDLKGTFFCQEPKQHSRCKNGFRCEEALMLHVYSRHMTKWRLVRGEKPVKALAHCYEKIGPSKIPELVSKMDEPRSCEVCNVVCPSVKTLISHYNNTHKDLPSTFICTKSSHCEAFKCEEALILHDYTRHLTKYRIKNETKPTKEQPEMSLSEVSELISKMDEPRKCQICEIECLNVYLLISHVNSDHTETELSFICSKSPQCESFRCEEELIFHEYTHCMMKKPPDEKVSEMNIEVDKLKHCPFCGTDNSLIEQFLIHFRKCSYKSNKVECPVCKEAISKTYISIHLRRAHAANRTLSVCDLCGKSISNLQQHMKRRHLDLHDKKFKCAECGERFETLSDVVQHRKTDHIDVIQSLTYRWECDICGQRYKSHGGLRGHKNLYHKKKMEHKCTRCGKMFKLRSLMEEHTRRIHFKEKNHKCKYCGKGFFYVFQVKSHMTVHTGEKRYECHVCQQRFRIRENLRTHLKRHVKSPRTEAW